MINKNDFPVLEFDTDKVAKLNPSQLVDKKFDSTRMIITFFPDVLIVLGQVGCPSCGGNLDLFYAWGPFTWSIQWGVVEPVGNKCYPHGRITREELEKGVAQIFDLDEGASYSARVNGNGE